jgi:hypothetical protein
MLYTLGAETFAPTTSVRFTRNDREICKQNDAYVVRIEFTLGDSITTPRKRARAATEGSKNGGNNG